MKHIAIALLLVAVMGGTSNAQLSFGGGAHGGLAFASFPQPLNEYYGVGFGGGANADLNIVRFLTLRMNLDYHSFPSDKAKLKNLFTVTDPNGNPAEFTVEGANRSIIGITLNAIGKIPTGSPVTPYGLLGFGMHIGSASDLKIVTSGQTFTETFESATKFGLNFGLGSEFKVGAAKLSAEVKYVLIFTENQNTAYIPVTLGVTF